MKKRRHHCRCF